MQDPEQNCETNWNEETHQLLIAKSGGSHGRGDSSFSRVLY